MMDMYQNALRALPAPMNPFELMQGRWAQPAAETGRSHSVNGSTGSPAQQDGPPTPPELRAQAADVDELKRRIGELESMLSKRVPRKTAAKKKGRQTKSRRKS